MQSECNTKIKKILRERKLSANDLLCTLQPFSIPSVYPEAHFPKDNLNVTQKVDVNVKFAFYAIYVWKFSIQFKHELPKLCYWTFKATDSNLRSTESEKNIILPFNKDEGEEKNAPNSRINQRDTHPTKMTEGKIIRKNSFFSFP